MSNMDRKTALGILRIFRDPEGPMFTQEELYQAIDVTIDALTCLTSKPDREYYGQ